MAELRRQLGNWLAIPAAFALVIGITVYVTKFVVEFPGNIDCETSKMAESWSPGRAFKAWPIRKICRPPLLADWFHYTIRIVSVSSDDTERWFIPVELNNDTYPDHEPDLDWVGPKTLRISVDSNEFEGRLTQHLTEGLTVIIAYRYSTP